MAGLQKNSAAGEALDMACVTDLQAGVRAGDILEDIDGRRISTVPLGCG